MKGINLEITVEVEARVQAEQIQVTVATECPGIISNLDIKAGNVFLQSMQLFKKRGKNAGVASISGNQHTNLELISKHACYSNRHST